MSTDNFKNTYDEVSDIPIKTAEENPLIVDNLRESLEGGTIFFTMKGEDSVDAFAIGKRAEKELYISHFGARDSSFEGNMSNLLQEIYNFAFQNGFESIGINTYYYSFPNFTKDLKLQDLLKKVQSL